MENNMCFRCKHFDRYYIKQVKRFEKTKFGHCCNKGEIVNCTGSCESFVFRKPRKVYEGFLKAYLSDLLTEITELRKTVEAELNENAEL